MNEKFSPKSVSLDEITEPETASDDGLASRDRSALPPS